MKTLWRNCFSVIIVLIAIGCASHGKGFNHAKRSDLVIGNTTPNEAEQLIGKPSKSLTVSNANGDFQVIQYVYSYADLTGASARVLTLEFRNKLLNANIYNSGFSEDSTDFKTEVLPQITRGVSNKTDVAKIMSEPTGKALCPSSLNDFKHICENSAEIWIWVYTQKSKGLDTSTIKSRFIRVAFNANDVVSNIESSVDH